MKKWIVQLIVLWSLAFGLNSLVACAQVNVDERNAEPQREQNCELDNSHLQAMPIVNVRFTRPNGSSFSSKARLANNDTTRGAGFQRVCASTIQAMPILFAFNREALVKFHMNNVVAPIDIAFIDKQGRIESFQAMQPYSLIAIKKPLYGPKRPVMYAFEAHPGYFKQHELPLKSRFSWGQ